jgi:4-aminobutyrate aminotransferase
VAGDAGWHVPPREWVRGVRDLCNKYGILYISEEVQTGFGRMGKWFGIQHYDVTPDIVVMGKAMAGGAAPMSGIIYTNDLEEIHKVGRLPHGHTMGGHPLGVATTMENIKIIEDEKLLNNSKNMGKYLLDKLNDDLVEKKSTIVGDVRGVSLLIGVEIVDPIKKDSYGRPAPAPELADEICNRAMKKGLWTIRMGAYGTSVLRVAPPLIIGKPQLNIAIDILVSSIKETEKAHR